MPTNSTPDVDIEDRREFENAVRKLLRAAHEGGVDVRGAVECRNDGSTPDWEVLAVELDDGG